MVAYALVAIACVIYTRREGMKNGLVWVAATIAVVSMAYVFVANVIPVPAFPLNVIPYVFFATMAVAIAWYIYLSKKRPEVIRNIGNTETDVLEGAA